MSLDAMSGLRLAPWLGGAALCLCAALPASATEAQGAVQVAIADIGFTDSSGEARDQGAEHETRRLALTRELRSGIEGEDLGSLALTCAGACRLDAEGVDELRRRAGAAGAAYVLVGSVHKMSTLVMSMRVAVLEAGSGKLVMERLLSFRGDNDEGWRHAGAYVTREVAAALPPR
ncbi:DUF3280 domain-containing protein [Starkeya koreensis]|uniref:DUF3280 domain-containing protein n=1 Tax=Ancylobacter koreensis TaxID=266121 RepID=A0ABT0DPQ0_9HYPH|nr:DUF2380 domain-containing protein [Ancylobacter koreensis]MCK0209263.1 DUF3280 domain-containing protein [Ancylobacter koreensis]